MTRSSCCNGIVSFGLTTERVPSLRPFKETATVVVRLYFPFPDFSPGSIWVVTHHLWPSLNDHCDTTFWVLTRLRTMLYG